jgi:oligopeptide/dipeptide ABC transporter ATP-binding protein
MPFSGEEAEDCVVDTALPLLELKDLTTVFPLRRGLVQAVDGLSFQLRRGEKLGIAGESGSGKSVSMLSILKLVPYPGKTVKGEVIFQGENLLEKPSAEMRKIRGKEIAMIFQDPMSTLNPVFRVGEQIRESLRIHGVVANERKQFWPFDRARRKAERQRVIEALEEVGIPIPDEGYKRYPHEFSGGMQQRVLIAIALSCKPKILLADEPTTALDVTIQAQILDLLNKINREHGTSIILVTHNLGVVAEFCDSIAVMYAGRMMEKGLTEEVTSHPMHPYTRGLLACLPRLTEKKKIHPIPGVVPDLINLPPGCPFAPRCDVAMPECREESNIPLKEVGGRLVRCLLY